MSSSDGGAPEQLAIEVVESHDLTGLAVACWLTGVFYGGACWGYLGAPFANQRAAAAQHFAEEARVIGRCADVVGVSVEPNGWDFTPRSVTVREMAGRMRAPTDVRELCRVGAPPPPPAGGY